VSNAANTATSSPGNPVTLWGDIKSWLHAPFKAPLDPVNWLLLLIISATIAFAWERVLTRVLEE
jgi:hypothetical protein